MRYERGEGGKDRILVGLSQKVRNFGLMEIDLMDEEGKSLEIEVAPSQPE